jgi:hypothetical protein
LEKSAEQNTAKGNKEVYIRRILKASKEVQKLNLTFPKGKNFLINGYVLERKIIYPNGRIVFTPIGKVVPNPKEGEHDSGD